MNIVNLSYKSSALTKLILSRSLCISIAVLQQRNKTNNRAERIRKWCRPKTDGRLIVAMLSALRLCECVCFCEGIDLSVLVWVFMQREWQASWEKYYAERTQRERSERFLRPIECELRDAGLARILAYTFMIFFFVPQLHCIYGSVYALEWRMLVAARRGWMLGTGYSYEVSAFRFSAFLLHAFGGGTKLNLPGIGAVNIIFNLNIKYCDV